MQYGRFFALLALLLLIFGLWRCGVVAQIDFERQCKRVARIEVKNPALWRQYLAERAHFLRQSKVTVDGKAIDPADLWPLFASDHFTYTSDLVRRKSDWPKNKIIRDDVYVTFVGTGEPVARFHDLRLSYQTIETTMSEDCTSRFPELYTGSRPHRGAIISGAR